MASSDSTLPGPAAFAYDYLQPWPIRRNAAADAIGLQNANNSMILRLPAEIRRKIWEFLIGNRLLHFKAVVHPHGRHCKSLGDGGYRVFDWVSTFCSCPYTEIELYERSKIPIIELAGRDDRQSGEKIDATGEVTFIGTPEQRLLARKSHLKQNPHTCCYSMATDFFTGRGFFNHEDHNHQKRQKYMLDLRVLRVCHQFYNEISPVLWTTNTFSFTSGQDLDMFLASRKKVHECMIRSLRVERHWVNWELPGMSPKHGSLKSLEGLQDLHIHVVNNAVTYCTADVRNERVWQSAIDDLCSGICDYRFDLPLKNIRNATVVIQDHPYGLALEWPLQTRLEQAEGLREMILDPNYTKEPRKQRRLKGKVSY